MHDGKSSTKDPFGRAGYKRIDLDRNGRRMTHPKFVKLTAGELAYLEWKARDAATDKSKGRP